MGRASGRLMFAPGRACPTAPRLALSPCNLWHPAPRAHWRGHIHSPPAATAPPCSPKAGKSLTPPPPATAPARAASAPACQSRSAAIPPPCASSSPNAASFRPHSGAAVPFPRCRHAWTQDNGAEAQRPSCGHPDARECPDTETCKQEPPGASHIRRALPDFGHSLIQALTGCSQLFWTSRPKPNPGTFASGHEDRRG